MTFLIAVLAFGCQAADRGPIGKRAGEIVEVTGELSGPGKDGFYVQAGEDQVFLPDLGSDQLLGQRVVARGRLQVRPAYDPCSGSKMPPEGEDCPEQGSEEMLYIEGASLEIAP
ncbi:hypothetical protein [Lysobacter humi (ex Lee et al. 2017)]